MTRLLVGIDRAGTAERLAAYCNDVVDAGDAVSIVNSLVGGEDTSADDVDDGEAALDAFEAAFEGEVDERRQFIRGNAPIQDLMQEAEEWGADEYVIGMRKRSPVGKVVFGSTAQNVLLEVELPVRAIPLASD